MFSGSTSTCSGGLDPNMTNGSVKLLKWLIVDRTSARASVPRIIGSVTWRKTRGPRALPCRRRLVVSLGRDALERCHGHDVDERPGSPHVGDHQRPQRPRADQPE